MSCCRNFVSYEYDNECNIVFTDAAGLQQPVSLKGGTAVRSSTGNEIVLTDIEGNQILIKEADSPITLIELQSAITDCHSSGPQPPTIFSIADITLTVGELLTINPFASGTAPITWSYSGVTADTFDSNTGALTFTTTSVGNLTINFNASNLYGSDNISVNVTVLAEAPVIAPIPSQFDLVLGNTFSYTPSLQEGTPPVTWYYDLGQGGNIGADSFDPATGALTYTPATDDPVTIIWVASNTNLAGGGQDAQQTILNVWEQPVVSLPANSPDTIIGQQVTITPTVVSGTEPLTWSLVQILPSVTPDSFNTSTGELVFTPVVETQYAINIQGSNFAGSDFAITAVDAGFVPVVDNISNQAVTTGDAVTVTPVASAGTTPITWNYQITPSDTADSFNTSTGEFVYTAPSAGTYSVEIFANNDFGTGSETFDIVATDPSTVAPLIAPINSTSIPENQSFSLTPSLIQGSPAPTWDFTVGPTDDPYWSEVISYLPMDVDGTTDAAGPAGWTYGSNMTYSSTGGPFSRGEANMNWTFGDPFVGNINLYNFNNQPDLSTTDWTIDVYFTPSAFSGTALNNNTIFAVASATEAEDVWGYLAFGDIYLVSKGNVNLVTPAPHNMVVGQTYLISFEQWNDNGTVRHSVYIDGQLVTSGTGGSVTNSPGTFLQYAGIEQSDTNGFIITGHMGFGDFSLMRATTAARHKQFAPFGLPSAAYPTSTVVVDSFDTNTGAVTISGYVDGDELILFWGATNIAGSDDESMTLTVDPAAGVIVMDAAWRSANGGATGPWTMDQEFATYRLEEDVNADRTAFIIGADNITMDITDSTITYNNITPTNITNAQFENGSTGWVLPTLPGGEVATVKTDAVYNQRECQTGTTSLELPPLYNDDNVNGISEYTFSTADSYTFQANEIYGITFWSNVWSIGSTGNRCRVSASIGGVSLLGVDGNGDPNPFSVNKPGTQHNGIVQLGATLTGPIEFRVYKYTTNTPDNPVTCYFDNFLISYAGCHGVCNKSSNLSESAQAGGAINNVDNFTFNSAAGSVIESTNPTLGGSCIFTKTVNGNSINGDVVLRTHPEDVLNISGRCITADYCTDLTVAESVVTDNRALRVTHRENLYGFSIHATAIKGTSNISTTAVSGCQGAITARPDGDPNASVTISGNGQQQTRFTNGFFINMYTDDGATGNFIVENVNVNNGVPASGNGGRGIHWDGANGNTGLCTIRDCVVVTQEQPLSQEYGINNDGYVLNGCYGIQVEGLSESLIIDNCDITVQGNYVMSGYRCNCNNLGDQLNSEMQNSTVRVLSSDPTTWLTGSSRASVILFAKIDGTLLGVQTNNTFIFNDCLVNMDNSCQNDIVFEGTTLQYIDAGTPQTNPYNVGYNGGGQYVFRNSSFADQGTKDWLTVDTQVAFAGGGTPSPVSYVRYVEDCDITLTDENGTPLTNFPAVITDNEGNVVFNGNTDANGKITQEFMWFEALLDGVNRTTTNNYGNPFTITTGYNGGTATWWILDETTRNEIIDVTTPIPLAPPVVAAIPDANITDGDTYNVTPTLVSGDQPITWSYTIDGSSTGADSFNTSTGEFTFTPASPATYNVVITASNSGGVDSVPFSITSVPLPSRPAYFYSNNLLGTDVSWTTPVITTNPGDLLVSMSVGRSMNYNAPGDWASEVSETNLPIDSQSGGGRLFIDTKVSPGESTTYTFTSVSSTSSSGCKVVILVFPNAAGFDMGVFNDNNGASGVTTSPAHTTTTANEEVIRVCWNNRNNGDPIFPAGWENLFDGTPNPGGDPSAGFVNPDGGNASIQIGYQVQPTPGVNGPVTLSYTPTFRAGMQNFVFSVQK